MQCPCKSGKDYQLCCEPYHMGKNAEVPEALMRSRYSAFVLGKTNYIFETEVDSLHKEISLDALENEIKRQKWIDLQIIKSGLTEVEFKATLLAGEELLVHHERSVFAEDGGRLKYVKADMMQSSRGKILRNNACPCGSGKKFKKCEHE